IPAVKTVLTDTPVVPVPCSLKFLNSTGYGTPLYPCDYNYTQNYLNYSVHNNRFRYTFNMNAFFNESANLGLSNIILSISSTNPDPYSNVVMQAYDSEHVPLNTPRTLLDETIEWKNTYYLTKFNNYTVTYVWKYARYSLKRLNDNWISRLGISQPEVVGMNPNSSYYAIVNISTESFTLTEQSNLEPEKYNILFTLLRKIEISKNLPPPERMIEKSLDEDASVDLDIQRAK
ncbi:73_t:CDS:2, partial [Dentiscutata heterogama]